MGAGDGYWRSGTCARSGHQLRGGGISVQFDFRALGADLIDPGSESLGQSARVREYERRGVLVDQVNNPAFDVWPDGVLIGLRIVQNLRVRITRGRRCGRGQVLNRNNDADLDHLLAWRVDYFNGCGSAEVQRNLLDRIDRCGQTDALSGPCEKLIKAL